MACHTRGRRIISLVMDGDKKRLGQLDLPVTKYETTEGVDLKKIDTDSLKKVLLAETKFEKNNSKEENLNLLPVSDVCRIEKDFIDSNCMSLTNEEGHKDICNFNETLDDPKLSSIPPFDGKTDPDPNEKKVKILSCVVLKHPTEQTINGTKGGPTDGISRIYRDSQNDSDSEPYCSSGQEYVPSSSLSSDSLDDLSDSDTVTPKNRNKTVDSFKKCSKDSLQIYCKENIATHQDHKRIGEFNQKGQVKSSTSKPSGTLKRDKKEHCVFCEKNVTNFSRHIIRIHKNEMEVQRLISLQKGSEERKLILDKIRKRGNFINSFGSEGFLNPTRRPKWFRNRTTSDYLPCIHCKGFYTRNYLHRHMKKCSLKRGETSKQAQSRSLTFLHMYGDVDFEDLRIKVFSRMASDEITQVVLNDYLIKCYGERYFKCHKEKHLINTVSQRMRELARFLMILKDRNSDVSQLLDVLKPSEFDELVVATNVISGYDADNDSFKSPSLALRWGTVLKQVCDIAAFICIKKNETTKQNEIETLKRMIETQFRFYVSTNAHKDLSSKNWKKGSMLPLTEDVIKLNQYVLSEEEKYVSRLGAEPSNKLYVRKLSEAILAHVILLNRKRSGEAQRITIEDYMRKQDDTGVTDIYQSLTATEKVLVQNIKRLIIRGKKGRAVPVIFTKKMQQHTELLLESGKTVGSNNPYLFANPDLNNSFLWSYKVLKTFAEAANVTNIEAITATCLRKHIATIAQVISMEDNDLEQLSAHLGHEKSTHLNFYRKTDDNLQIAKVSKLLLLMEKKSMGEYRGKTLQDIDLEIPDLDDIQALDEPKTVISKKGKIENLKKKSDRKQKTNSKLDSKPTEEILDGEDIKEKTPIEVTDVPAETNKGTNTRGRVLIPWTNEQKKFANMFFKKHLKEKKTPKKGECEELQNLHPETFHNKTWAQIKIFIVNEYNKKQ